MKEWTPKALFTGIKTKRRRKVIRVDPDTFSWEWLLEQTDSGKGYFVHYDSESNRVIIDET